MESKSPTTKCLTSRLAYRKGGESISRKTDRHAASKSQTHKAKSKRPSAAELADDPPIQSNGWTLLQWPAFGDRWRALIAEVERLREKDPQGYTSHPTTRFLALLHKKVMDDIPSDPGAKQFRQGKTMGNSYIHWRRAKFGGRFRLFFDKSKRFSH